MTPSRRSRPQINAGAQPPTTPSRSGITASIVRESARRLARLGGSEPDAALTPRRRPDSGNA